MLPGSDVVPSPLRKIVSAVSVPVAGLPSTKKLPGEKLGDVDWVDKCTKAGPDGFESRGFPRVYR